MKPVLVYNWKTYITSNDEAVTLANTLEGSDSVEVVVCPSALHSLVVAKAIHKKNISLGIQDISTAADNPRTGNISGAQASDAGATYAIVGHAETRAAGVTDAMVADKVHHALLSNLIPILCLSEQGDSEHKDDKEIVQQLEEVLQQNKEEIQKLSNEQRIIIAYEPTQHIGAQDALAPEKVKHIVKILRETIQQHKLQDTPIIYGGAVNPENAEGIIEIADINGFLLGRASTNANTANTILQYL